MEEQFTDEEREEYGMASAHTEELFKFHKYKTANRKKEKEIPCLKNEKREQKKSKNT